jgi:hypothetical protein
VFLLQINFYKGDEEYENEQKIKRTAVFISVSHLILHSRNLSHLRHGEVFNIETVYVSGRFMNYSAFISAASLAL